MSHRKYPSRAWSRPARIGSVVLVDEGECAVDELDERRGLAGQVGGVRGLAQEVDEVDARPATAASGTRSQNAERPLGLPVGIDVGMHRRRRRDASIDATRASGALPGRRPVEGQLGGRAGHAAAAIRAGIAEVRGDRLVPSAAFARQQVGDHDLGQQRVPEAVPVGRGGRPRGSAGSRRRGSPSRGRPRPGRRRRSGAHRRSGPRRPRPPAGRVGRPATSVAIRPARMSCSEAGSATTPSAPRSTRRVAGTAVAASSSLASNSSAKNGLPSARAWIRSATPRAGRRPRMAVSCWRCSARSSGRSSMRSTLRLRPISARRTRSGWPRSRSSERNVPIEQHATATKVPDQERQEVARRRIAPVEVFERRG